MQFESLANEILLEIFEYLDSIHMFCAFYDLNTRLNTLIIVYFRHYQLDFRSIRKKDFHLVCRRFLPLVNSRVIQICLSNNDETPLLFDHFLMHNLTFNQFTHLKSLTLLHVGCLQKINQIFIESLFCTMHLSYLAITDCFNKDIIGLNYLIKHIWLLPKLVHCYLKDCVRVEITLSGLSIVSSSIEYLSMKNLELSFKDLNHLYEHTPRLRYIQTTLVSNDEVSTLAMVPNSLTTLNIYLRFSCVTLECLLRNAAHLHRLVLKTEGFYVDGHQWEQIIVNHLPNIKSIRFLMNFKFEEYQNVQELIETLLNTFRTSFWLNDRGWFVRCEWNSQNLYDNIYLYTLPMFSDDLYILDSTTCHRSTCSNDPMYCSYDAVQNLLIRPNVNECQQHLCRFSKIKSINATLPIHKNVWPFISTFKYVTFLHLSNHESTTRIEYQLEILINQMTSLYSLAVNEQLALRLSSMKITNRSIRRVDCFERCDWFRVFFDANDCSKWIASDFSRQCEVFCIKVESQENIIDLVKKMPNLRALICECQRDKRRTTHTLSSNRDDFIEDLKDSLQSKCYLNRDVKNSKRIQLWIEK